MIPERAAQPGLDHADPAAWALWPEAADGPALDLFYVHPTTLPDGGWNQPADMPPDLALVERQTAPFARTCRRFAPRYRQATGRAFREPGADADAAYRLAYRDVVAAFRRFAGQGRPFVLAGHSQGALHLARLLREVVEPEGLDSTLVAAYLVGIGLSEALFGRCYRRLVPCERPDQTGCVASWNCFLDAPGSDPGGFLWRTRERDRALLGSDATGRPICINPLSFDTRVPLVPAAGNPGSLVAGEGDRTALVSGLVGAHDRGDGVLWVSPRPEPRLGLQPLAQGTMHMHDIDLFHAALGADAARRGAAFLARAG